MGKNGRWSISQRSKWFMACMYIVQLGTPRSTHSWHAEGPTVLWLHIFRREWIEHRTGPSVWRPFDRFVCSSELLKQLRRMHVGRCVRRCSAIIRRKEICDKIQHNARSLWRYTYLAFWCRRWTLSASRGRRMPFGAFAITVLCPANVRVMKRDMVLYRSNSHAECGAQVQYFTMESEKPAHPHHTHITSHSVFNT